MIINRKLERYEYRDPGYAIIDFLKGKIRGFEYRIHVLIITIVFSIALMIVSLCTGIESNRILKKLSDSIMYIASKLRTIVVVMGSIIVLIVNQFLN